MEFTGLPDTDRLILLNLEGGDLLHACQTSQYVQSLCADDLFWREKILQEYGLRVSQMRPPGMSYRQQYLDFTKVLDQISNMSGSRIIVKLGKLKKERPDLTLGLVGRILSSPEKYKMRMASLLEIVAYLGEFDLLVELLKKFPQDNAHKMVIANGAAEGGHFGILNYFASQGILPDFVGPILAAGAGRLDVLNWMEQHGVQFDVRTATAAAENGKIDVLNWLEQRGILPENDVADLAAGNGHIDTLIWLARRGILFGAYGVDLAVGNGHLAVADLGSLLDPPILPTQFAATYSAMEGNINSLEWLESKNIHPDVKDANAAAEYGHINILNWMAQKGVFPDNEGLNAAANRGRLDVLVWMRRKGLL